MTFAEAYEDPPRVWGVGRIVVNGQVTPWPVSQADIEDEADSQATALGALGLGAGDLVLVVAMLSEAVHAVPIEKAAGRCGALYSSADATPSDAFRVAALVRQLEPKLVVGVTTAVLDGLDHLGRRIADVLRDVAMVVVADAPSEQRVRDAGIAPRRWAKLGPTSAFQVDGDGTFAYDATRWRVDEEDGELLVTNLASRLTPARRLRTGLRGGCLDRPGRIALG